MLTQKRFGLFLTNKSGSCKNVLLAVMAFQPTNAREQANRKILEELQIKKQLLLKQGAGSALSSNPTLPLSTIPNIPANMTPDHMSSAQRAAMTHAHALSFGFFVPQDSSFGNVILPVLPRFDTK